MITFLAQIALTFAPSPNALPITYDKIGNPDSYMEYKFDGTDIPNPAHFLVECILPDGSKFAAPFSTFTLQESCAKANVWYGWNVFHGRNHEILGCHIWQTCRADQTIEWAVQISNGTVDLTDLSTCGGVFYDEIRISIASRFDNYYEARRGESVRNGTISLGKGEHYFPKRFSTTRRGTLFAGALGERYARGVFNKSDLQIPKRLSGFGVLKGTYSSVSDDLSAREWTDKLTQFTVSGRLDGFEKKQGNFFPLGGFSADEVGGDGIVPVFEGPPSAPLALKSRYIGDLRADRTPTFAATRIGGEPIGPRLWARGGNDQGFEYHLTRGKNLEIPVFRNRADFNSGTSAEKDVLEQFAADDDAHESRYTKPNQLAAYIFNDPVAKYRLAMVHADNETSWSLYGQKPFEPVYQGQYIAFSLEQALYTQAKNPHRGGKILRSVGWVCDNAASVISLTPPGRKRSELLIWANKMLDYVSLSTLPTGIGLNGGYPYESNGVPWNTYGAPISAGVAPYFQIPIWCNGIFGLCQNVAGREDVLQQTVVKSADQIFFGQLPAVSSVWGGDVTGPPYYIRTSSNNVIERTLSVGYGGSHWLHCYHHLALAYRATRDPKYLERLKRMAKPTGYPEWTVEGDSVSVGADKSLYPSR